MSRGDKREYIVVGRTPGGWLVGDFVVAHMAEDAVRVVVEAFPDSTEDVFAYPVDLMWEYEIEPVTINYKGRRLDASNQALHTP